MTFENNRLNEIAYWSFAIIAVIAVWTGLIKENNTMFLIGLGCILISGQMSIRKAINKKEK